MCAIEDFKKALLSGGSICEFCHVIAGCAVVYFIFYLLRDIYRANSIPTLSVDVSEAEKSNELKTIQFKREEHTDKDIVPCYDPSTMQFLGNLPAMSASEVKAIIQKSRVASQEWKKSSFETRRKLLRILLKFIIDNQETICRVSARDSGKPIIEAVVGEVVVTCEKIHWLINEGEKHLRPDQRSAGIMAFYKKARVEYHPVGVIGAIVPFNYPFHNVLNPLTAALFSGNSIVIKVSEHASWSTGYYGRFIRAALAAAGAPPNLVQFVTGYGEAGNALVTGGVDKVIFVGSTQVGKLVMRAAADRLTPVVLELGGKDPFIVGEDADIESVAQTALKAAFLNCGQNCAGGERFFIHEKVYDKFLSLVVPVVRNLRQGNPLGATPVDCGALCMPGLAEKVQGLIDDAVAQGAELLAGGKLPAAAAAGSVSGQFYPPTVIAGIRPGMKVWEEEVFGPVMSVIKWKTDEEVIALANHCAFGLGSSVFCRSQARARGIAEKLESGMSAINDFGTTYMCQSLPFGGVKDSGFDRFAGIEGLRGLCVPKAVCEDRWPWLIRSSIPPPLQYPVKPNSESFGMALVTMFYGPGLAYKATGLYRLLLSLAMPNRGADKKRN